MERLNPDLDLEMDDIDYLLDEEDEWFGEQERVEEAENGPADV